ncbi:hypothetical protein ACRRU2_26100 [Paenibacillus sp. GXUN7292]
MYEISYTFYYFEVAPTVGIPKRSNIPFDCFLPYPQLIDTLLAIVTISKRVSFDVKEAAVYNFTGLFLTFKGVIDSSSGG